MMSMADLTWAWHACGHCMLISLLVCIAAPFTSMTLALQVDEVGPAVQVQPQMHRPEIPWTANSSTCYGTPSEALRVRLRLG